MNNFLSKKAEDSIEEIEIESSNAAEERIAVDTGTNQSASRNSKPRENVSSNTGEKSSKSQPKTLEEFLDHQCHTNLLTFKLVKTDSPEFQETVEESHRLYVSYQTKIHQDKADKCTMDRFKGFLVESPLKVNNLYNIFEPGSHQTIFRSLIETEIGLFTSNGLRIIPSAILARKQTRCRWCYWYSTSLRLIRLLFLRSRLQSPLSGNLCIVEVFNFPTFCFIICDDTFLAGKLL